MDKNERGLEGTDLTIKSTSDEAKKLLGEVFKNLADPTPKDKFFPNGIELIFIKVEVGLTEKTKISAEIRVAGERAPKESVSSLDESRDEPKDHTL